MTIAVCTGRLDGQPLLNLGEHPGALGAAVLARRNRHRLPDELVHPLAGVLVQVYFGHQCGDALEASFVAIIETLRLIWRKERKA